MVPSGAEKQRPFSSKHRHWSPLISEVGLRAKKSHQHGASAVSKPHGAEFWHLPAPGWRQEPIPGTGWARAGSGARGPPAKDQMAQVTLWEVLFFFTTLQKKRGAVTQHSPEFPWYPQDENIANILEKERLLHWYRVKESQNHLGWEGSGSSSPAISLSGSNVPSLMASAYSQDFTAARGLPNPRMAFWGSKIFAFKKLNLFVGMPEYCKSLSHCTGLWGPPGFSNSLRVRGGGRGGRGQGGRGGGRRKGEKDFCSQKYNQLGRVMHGYKTALA